MNDYDREYIAIPPGETIREQLNKRLISLKKFGEQMEMSEKQINNLLRGKLAIDKNIAIKLQNIFGVPMAFWLNIEKIYRSDLIQINKK